MGASHFLVRAFQSYRALKDLLLFVRIFMYITYIILQYSIKSFIEFNPIVVIILSLFSYVRFTAFILNGLLLFFQPTFVLFGEHLTLSVQNMLKYTYIK